jgi:hypothetical protein
MPLLTIVVTQLVLFSMAASQASAALDHALGEQQLGVTATERGGYVPDPLIDPTPAEVRSLGGTGVAEHIDAAPVAFLAAVEQAPDELVDDRLDRPAVAAGRTTRAGRAPPT